MSGYADFATHIAGSRANGRAKRWCEVKILADSRESNDRFALKKNAEFICTIF